MRVLASKITEVDRNSESLKDLGKIKLKEEFRKINEILKEGCQKGYFSEKDLEAAEIEKPKAGRLYGLPKDHKPICKETGIPPLRCVVFCCGANLEGLGKIVDYFLRAVDEATPSYIQDTPHLSG